MLNILDYKKVHLECIFNHIYFYLILDGELKDKVLSRKHEINGKIVDVKLAVEGKKREEMLDSSKKIFVGGLDPTVTNGNKKNIY